MYELVWSLVLMLLLNPILQHTLGPILVWRRIRRPGKVEFLAEDDHEFLQLRQPDFHRRDAELQQSGFVPLVASRMRNDNSECFFRLYWHADTHLTATLAECYAAKNIRTFLELSQSYPDGRRLSLHDSPVGNLYPPVPQHARFWLADPHPLSTWMALVAQIQGRQFPGVIPCGDAMLQPLAALTDSTQRDVEEAIEQGLLHPDSDAQGRHAMTLKGAFVLSSRIAKPGCWLVRARARRRTQAWLARLDSQT